MRALIPFLAVAGLVVQPGLRAQTAGVPTPESVLGYQVGAVLSGGIAPLVATALLAAYDGEPTGVIIYVFILGIISTGCTFLARETYKDKWEGAPH